MDRGKTGAERAAARLERHRKIWADTPLPASGHSRQVGRHFKRLMMKAKRAVRTAGLSGGDPDVTIEKRAREVAVRAR